MIFLLITGGYVLVVTFMLMFFAWGKKVETRALATERTHMLRWALKRIPRQER